MSRVPEEEKRESGREAFSCKAQGLQSREGECREKKKKDVLAERFVVVDSNRQERERERERSFTERETVFC